jgi:broad specificity phosphatase PhoE
MPRLYFMRHGETDWNRDGRLQGHTETALNRRGRQQAERVGRHLAALVATEMPGRLETLPFYVSPMHRTRQTVEILRASAGLVPEIYQADDRLREIGFGSWEGRSWYEIKARDPISARDRNRDRWHFQPPGGESYAMVSARVAEWLATIDQDACIVAHGGVARVMMVLCGGVWIEDAVRADIWQGKILVLDNRTMAWHPEPGHD